MTYRIMLLVELTAPAETCCVPIVRGRGKCDES